MTKELALYIFLVLTFCLYIWTIVKIFISKEIPSKSKWIHLILIFLVPYAWNMVVLIYFRKDRNKKLVNTQEDKKYKQSSTNSMMSDR